MFTNKENVKNLTFSRVLGILVEMFSINGTIIGHNMCYINILPFQDMND